MAESSPNVAVQVYRVVKHGNAENEIEDACKLNAKRGRFAVSDGATESSFADIWAKLLVTRYVQQPLDWPPDWTKWLPALQAYWQRHVDSQKLPWYAADKAAQGAYATLLGLELRADHSWRAVAVGDSCLFQIREDKLRLAFPLTNFKEFNTRPYLIGSRTPPAELNDADEVNGMVGDWQPQDRFLLMTDALAAWFLRQSEAEELLPDILEFLVAANHERFTRLIQELRTEKSLKNDDVTLIQVTLGGERVGGPEVDFAFES